jgi:flagellar hook assembly protein FlgD
VARFGLAASGPVRLAVYDVRGREVARLVDAVLAAGDHEVEWKGENGDGARAPSGVYFVALSSDGGRIARRVVLLR